MTSRSDYPNGKQRLGDFEIVREIGRGGMGVVYEARQVSLNRHVALKVLGDRLGLSSQGVSRFRREAEAAAKLHHTNIVPVYATGETDGTLYYAMELIEGSSLDRVLRNLRRAHDGAGPSAQPMLASSSAGSSPLPLDALAPDLAATGPYVPLGESCSSPSGFSGAAFNSGSTYFDAVARMIADVADALAHAHENGVIHRDIKPSNLLLSLDGRLNVSDFGLARVLEQPGMTLSGEFVGTPAYMSPEQITAGRIPLDHRTDIYSLGATLYELLTMMPPFQGQSREQVLAQIVQKDPRPPRKLNKRVPIDLETICLKAMDKDPDRRYQTAGQLAEDLRRHVNRFAISARRVGPVGHLLKWSRRHPALTASLAGAVVLALMAGGFAYQAHASRQQLMTERRQNAVEKALLAAMSGDFREAGHAIAEAERLGASTGQVRMLHGQVALHGGQLPAAIEHLEQAVRLLPDSVAARSMLAVAYFHDGQSDIAADRCLGEVQNLVPTTPEDFLFKGHAESFWDPVRGLKTLDDGLHRRESAIARLVRAEIRTLRTFDTNDVADAELAIKDVDVAKDLLPNNSCILAVSLKARVAATIAYERMSADDKLSAGDRSLAQAKTTATLDQAQREARALERFPLDVECASARWAYLELLRNDEATFDLCRQSWEQRKHLDSAIAMARMYYRVGKIVKSREVLDQAGPTREQSYQWTVQHLVTLAESPDGHRRALDAYHAIPVQDTFGGAAQHYQAILRLFGRKTESVAACRSLREQIASHGQRLPWRGEWYARLLDFYCGDLTPDQLLRIAGPSNYNQCEGHYHIAMTALADGDREIARQHFQQSIATRVLTYIEYEWSRTFLARMEQDRDWPPWMRHETEEKEMEK